MRLSPAITSFVFCASFAFACGKSTSSPDDGIPLPDRGDDAGTDSNTTSNEDSGTSIVDAGRDANDDASDGGGGLRVFATSQTTKGKMGGLAGADAICTAHAKLGSLPGTFVAWLSVENGPHASDRVTSAGPWRLVSGEVVATTKAELLSGNLKHAIDRDEKGVTVVPAIHVWTGSGTNGRYLTNDCDKWTNGNNGRVGQTDMANAGWTTIDVDDCDALRRLYCFQL